MQLQDVNTTDIEDAVRLACRAMGQAFNADDANMPYGLAQARPVAFLSGSMEGHMPGRLLNGLLTAEAALGIPADAEVVDKLSRALWFSYSRAPLPLQRIGTHRHGEGDPIELHEHNLREGFHALHALVAFRQSERAMDLAKASIQLLVDYWVPRENWDVARLERDTPVRLREVPNDTFIQGAARAIGPLIKLYRASGYGPALELATVLKDKALREFFHVDGAYEAERFGLHVHSTTSTLSSLAQLAACTGDETLLQRVRAFYDHGLWELRDQIGWAIEVSTQPTPCRRGEANTTGDIIETTLILGRHCDASYYADAERMLRGHLLPSQLRDVSWIEASKDPGKGDGYKHVAERLRGGFGFPAPHGHEPVGIWQSDKPRISFNIDIVGGVTGSLVAAWQARVRHDEEEHWVDLLFDCCTDFIEIQSPYTHANLAVKLKTPGTLHLRLPSWAQGEPLHVHGQPPVLRDGYAVFEHPPVGKWITLDLKLPKQDLTLTWRDSRIRARLRGDEIVAMQNFGTDLTYFPDLD
jgi:hypothetical protein